MILILGKSPNISKRGLYGSKQLLGLFWVEFLRLLLVGLVLCNVCKREMLGFQRKCCQNFVKTPVIALAIG